VRAILPLSKAPIHRNKSRWGEAEKQLVLEARCDKETYGKEKIGAILRRGKNQTMSDSTVGRILGFLRMKGQITRSRSAPEKRKHNFSKGHAEGWGYKDYKDIEVGERVQIDHMTATKIASRANTFKPGSGVASISTHRFTPMPRHALPNDFCKSL
jgi:putative transposase